jgi:hypothetical protein
MPKTLKDLELIICGNRIFVELEGDRQDYEYDKVRAALRMLLLESKPTWNSSAKQLSQ